MQVGTATLAYEQAKKNLPAYKKGELNEYTSNSLVGPITHIANPDGTVTRRMANGSEILLNRVKNQYGVEHLIPEGYPGGPSSDSTTPSVYSGTVEKRNYTPSGSVLLGEKDSTALGNKSLGAAQRSLGYSGEDEQLLKLRNGAVLLR